MGHHTLFGELALRLSPHPENLATEALRYILDRHPAAWPSVGNYIGRTGLGLPGSLSFRTQVWGEGVGQPDLIGVDQDGRNRLVVEAKFWAGLTENQPVSYISALGADAPSVLLFLCPAQRVESLWEKLGARLREAQLHLGSTQHIEPGFLSCPVVGNHQLTALSWAQLLGVLNREAGTANDQELLSDTNQLKGLCDRMDMLAFLPLRPEHLGSDVGMRIQHFAEMVDQVVPELVRHHGADTAGLTTGGRQSAYGRYFRIGSLGLFLEYSPYRWSRYGETPFWLQVKHDTGNEWVEASWIPDALDRLPPGQYRRLPQSEASNIVGLDVPTGVEHQEVIESLISQVIEISRTVSTQQPTPRRDA